MARRYNTGGGSDPWSISQRFLDQYAQTTENMRRERVKEQAEARKPDQVYQNAVARGQAKFDTAETFRAAGLNPNGTPIKGVNNLKIGERIKTPFAQEFMGTVQEKITNPYALAAVAATVDHESKWSRVHDEWQDDSPSGNKGRSGLAMSWRDSADGKNRRLSNARNFIRNLGDDPRKPSARSQALFFLSENPALIQRLNSAPNLATAVRHMRDAWGYHDPNGSETQNRFRTAEQYLPHVGGSKQTAKDSRSQLAELSPEQTEPAAQVYTDENGKPYTLERQQPSKLSALNKWYLTDHESLKKYGTNGPYVPHRDGESSGGTINVRNYLKGEIMAQRAAAQQTPKETVDENASAVDNTPQQTAPVQQPVAKRNIPEITKTPGVEDNVFDTPVKNQVRRVVKPQKNEEV